MLASSLAPKPKLIIRPQTEPVRVGPSVVITKLVAKTRIVASEDKNA